MVYLEQARTDFVSYQQKISKQGMKITTMPNSDQCTNINNELSHNDMSNQYNFLYVIIGLCILLKCTP